MFNKTFIEEVNAWASNFGLGATVDGAIMTVSGAAGNARVEDGKGVVEPKSGPIRKKLDELYAKFNKPALCEDPSSYDKAIEPPAEVVDKAEGLHKKELIDELKRVFDAEGDMIEIFGKSGSCKSKFMEEVARSALRLGLRVVYLDSERNLSRGFINELGKSYIYNPKFDELKKLSSSLPTADVLLFDSVGLPALTKVARMGRGAGANEKGGVYLDMEAMYGNIKDWCFDNKAIAIVSNQPKSEFQKTDEQKSRLEPFGDKCRYLVKHVLRMTKMKSPGNSVTHVDIISHRTRDFGDDEVLGSVIVSNEGTRVKFVV